MTVQIRSLESKPVAVADDAVEALRARLRGTVALNGDAGYDEARTVWNAMVDRKPGLVVRARGAGDVCAAVDFARENGLLLSVRSGGHQIAGHSVAPATAGPGETLTIQLKYSPERLRTISGLRRVSKPGLRVYSNAEEIPRVLGGLGVAVLSTNQGLMTDREARKRRVGGEVLCYVW